MGQNRTKDQIAEAFKKDLDDTTEGEARDDLLHCLWALDNDPTLSGKNLWEYKGRTGKKIAPRTTGKAKKLLGIKTASTSKQSTRNRRVVKSPASLVEGLIKDLQDIVDAADKKLEEAEKDYKEKRRNINEESADARRRLEVMEKAASELEKDEKKEIGQGN